MNSPLHTLGRKLLRTLQTLSPNWLKRSVQSLRSYASKRSNLFGNSATTPPPAKQPLAVLHMPYYDPNIIRVTQQAGYTVQRVRTLKPNTYLLKKADLLISSAATPPDIPQDHPPIIWLSNHTSNTPNLYTSTPENLANTIQHVQTRVVDYSNADLPSVNDAPSLTSDPEAGRMTGGLLPEVPERAGLILLGIALLIVVLFHGVLLFQKSSIHTYDALIHIFFGAHYAETWFDPWEPRWYTGFFTVAYPPLSHYLIALSSKLVGLLTGFAFVQLFAVSQLTVGVYRFSRLLAGPRAAGYASIALALSSAIAETVHVFGQLPTTLSLGFLLNAIPFIWMWVRLGKPTDLFKAVVWTAATTSAHHVTTLFGSVFFTGPMIVILLLAAFRSPRPGEPTGDSFMQKLKRRSYRLLPRLYRTGIFGVLAITMLLLVVFPYWYWSGTDPIIQVSIPHGSRENFLVRRDLGLMFWVIPWASTIWFFPYAMYKGFANWRWPAAASILLLAVLGTGGTTPIPRFLLRSAFDILTLDRFTFWSTMFILPFVGMGIESALHGRLKTWMDANFGRRVRQLLLLTFMASVCAAAIMISTLTQYRKSQPDPINIDPIIGFINKDEHWRYRYLNLGFGDQMAWLSANTHASTPDGNYHSARRLPEMTTTPIERLEGAKYTGVPGIGSLEQFLTVPEKYNLKFIFSNDAFYDPLLYFYGWHSLGPLENGIIVWEREDIPPLPERLPRKTWPIYQRLMWGILPMAAPILAYLSLLLPSINSFVMPWQRRGLGLFFLKLLREDALTEQPSSTWQPWHRFVRPLEEVLNFSRRSFGFRLLATLLLFVNLAWPLALMVHKQRQAADTLNAAVISYWDHLDFKRFDKAYQWLEPEDGLSFDRWLLDFSVVGGLRSGFAKLDSIEPEVVSYDGEGSLTRPKIGDRAHVNVHLSWLTSLSEIHETLEHDLVRTKNGWRIIARPLSKVRTQDRFMGQPDVAYYRAPRRLTTDITAKGDVLDRPKLVINDARLVSYTAQKTDLELEADAVFGRGPAPDEVTDRSVTRFSIVGSLQNVDARPADVTLTGILRSKTGASLTKNNAGAYMIHKLLPGERTPFRIDFDAVASPENPDEVADFELFAKAVVTSLNLERDLASWTYQQNNSVQIRAVNIGTSEAIIPHALLSLYDTQGLAWVEESYGLESIPPREAREFAVTYELPTDYKVVLTFEQNNDEGTVFDNNNDAQGIQVSFPLQDPQLNAYLVQLHGFYKD